MTVIHVKLNVKHELDKIDDMINETNTDPIYIFIKNLISSNGVWEIAEDLTKLELNLDNFKASKDNERIYNLVKKLNIKIRNE